MIWEVPHFAHCHKEAVPLQQLYLSDFYLKRCNTPLHQLLTAGAAVTTQFIWFCGSKFNYTLGVGLR
jgi:hypothetical protein